MTRILFLILLAAFILIQSTQSELPFKLTSDMAPEKNKKRIDISQKDIIGTTHFTDRSKEILMKTPESDLLEIRCSDGFIRTFQGVYMLENVKASNKEKRRVRNKEFIEFMRNKEPKLPSGARILSARVCDIESTILLFYTIGEYESKEADYQTPRITVLNSTNNKAFVQLISSSLFAVKTQTFEIGSSTNHKRCDKPFQISKGWILSVLCVEKETFLSTYTVNQIDLNKRTIISIDKCLNSYKTGLEVACN